MYILFIYFNSIKPSRVMFQSVVNLTGNIKYHKITKAQNRA